MAELGSLQLKFNVDDSRLKRGLSEAESAGKKTGASIAKSIDSATKSANNLGSRGGTAFKQMGTSGSTAGRQIAESMKKAESATRSASSAGGGFSSVLSNMKGTIATIGLTALAAGFALVGKNAIQAAADAQKLTVSLTTFYGSATKGKQALEDLTKFAASTPFEIPEIRKAGTSLAAFGVAQEKLIPTLKNLGNIAAGVNAPIGEIAEIYGKARVQGRLFMEDINQFQGRGIPIMDALAKTMKKTPNEIRELVAAGKVGFPELEKAFESLNAKGGKFSGLMEAQSQTIGGQLSNLSDKFTMLSEKVGLALSPSVASAVSAIAGTMDKLGQAVSNVSNSMEGLKLLRSITDGLGEAWRTITQAVGEAFKEVGLGNKQFDLTKAATEAILGGLRLMNEGVQAFTRYLRENPQVLEAIKIAVKLVVAGIRLGWEAVKILWDRFKTGISVIGEIIKRVSSMVVWIKNAIGATVNFGNTIRDKVGGAWNLAGQQFKRFQDWVGKGFDDLFKAGEKFGGVFRWIGDRLNDLGKNPFFKFFFGGGAEANANANADNMQSEQAQKMETGGVNSEAFGTSATKGTMLAKEGLAGVSPPLRAIATAAMNAGLHITSTTGGKHAPGSNHYSGRALDLDGGPAANMRFARAIMNGPLAGRVRELFYDPLGSYLKNGQKIPGAIGGHGDHVHLSLNKGGVVPGSGNRDSVPAMLTPGEMVIPKGLSAEIMRGMNNVHHFNKGTLSSSQIAHAKTIIQVGLSKGMSERAIKEALASALVESELKNLNSGHADSVGLFQQRQQGYGSVANRTNPRKAAEMFYQEYNRVGKKYESKGFGVPSIKTQRPAKQYEYRYATRQSQANSLYGKYAGSGASSTSSSVDTASETPAQRAKRKREEEEKRRSDQMTKWKENREKALSESRTKADRKTTEARAKRDSALDIAETKVQSEAAKKLIAITREQNKANDELADKLTVISRKRQDLKAEQSYKIKNKVKGGMDYTNALKLLDEEEKYERSMIGTQKATEAAKRNQELAEVNKQLADSYGSISDKAEEAALAMIDGAAGQNISAIRAINRENNEQLKSIDEQIAARKEVLTIDPKNIAAAEQLKALETERSKVAGITAERLQDQAQAYEQQQRAAVSSQLAELNSSNAELLQLRADQAAATGDEYGSAKLATDLAIMQAQNEHLAKMADINDRIEESQRKIAEYQAKQLFADATLEEGNLNTLEAVRSNESIIGPGRIKLLQDSFKDLGATIRTEFVDNIKSGLKGLIDGSKGLLETIGDLFGSIASKFLDLGIQNLFNPGAFGGQGIGQFLGRVLGFNRGGVVPGIGNRDTVPALLTPGEVVLNKTQVQDMRVGSGGGGINLSGMSITIGGDSGTSPQDAARFQKVLTGRIKEVIIEEQRNGGTLYKARR